MKKSRIAKLALMGASITALAATLTTSTYAWYVSNKTANVNAVSGSTAEGASDGSISLSTSGNVNEYYKTISLDAAENFNAVSNGVALEPVTTTDGKTFIQPEFKKATGTYVSGTTYYEQVTNTTYYQEKTGLKAGDSIVGLYTYNEETGKYTLVETGTYSGGKYYEYSPKSTTSYQEKTGLKADDSVENYYVWDATDVTEGNSKFFHMSFFIKSAAAVTVIPTITVKNTTTEVPTAVNYSANNNVLSVDNGATFTIDAIYSLHASLVQTPGAAYTASQTTYSATTPLATQFQAVDGAGKIKATASSAIAAYANKATGGAHNYFKEIMGYDPYTTAVGYESGKAFGNITLQANTPMKLDYYFWLDGGDDQCLNPCVKQNFEFQFSYTVSA